MMKNAPLIFLFLGIVLIWIGGVQGRLGTFLAVLFDPSKVKTE